VPRKQTIVAAQDDLMRTVLMFFCSYCTLFLIKDINESLTHNRRFDWIHPHCGSTTTSEPEKTGNCML